MIKLRQRFVKRVFDPTKKEDLLAYKYYVKHKGWGANGCPFELEYPWNDIPSMLAHKIAEYAVLKA